jgi:Ala-tRNA(Pro) deacylase
MMQSRLQQFLQQKHIPFEVIKHTRAITAYETAARAHIDSRMLAKTVMVILDGRLSMVVLPAAQRIHMGRLRKATGARTAELATEADFSGRFPDCEVGAMPPFGNLYGMDVYVDAQMARHAELVTDADIVFNASNHTELIRMPYVEFERAVAPRHIDLAE